MPRVNGSVTVGGSGGGLVVPGMAFVPGTVNTRRSILAQGATGAAGLVNNYTDTNVRFGATLPVTPTRFRFRIRNSNALGNTTEAQAIALTGIAIGALGTYITGWPGIFASTPTVVVGAATIDPGATGAEYVSPWVTNTGQMTAYVPFGISYGFTTPGGNVINTDFCPGLEWSNPTIAAPPVNGQFANAAIPTTGSLGQGVAPLDFRIEYEYVGSNPIGLFLGTSLTMGILAAGGQFGNEGPDEAWPNMACLRMGHACLNGAVDASSTPTYDGAPASSIAWTRIFDTTFPALTWPGGCTPDYAVIDLGVNDAGGGTAFATFQANMASIIGNLNALGIFRIIVCVPPSLGSGAAYVHHGMSGPLNTAIAASGSVASTLVTILTNFPTGLGGGGGFPGAAATWNGKDMYLGSPVAGNLDGPYNVTAASESAVLLTLTSSGTATFAHPIGDAVMGGGEANRQVYAQWLRRHPRGTMATFDLSEACELPNPTVPGCAQVNWKYFGPTTTGPHPVDPSMYEVIGTKFAGAHLLGI